MTTYQILSAVNNSDKHSIEYLSLLNLSLTDEHPDTAADKMRIQNLLRKGYLSGETRPGSHIRLEPIGLDFIEQCQQKLAEKEAEEKRQWKSAWFQAVTGIISSLVGAVVGALLTLLIQNLMP